MSNPILVTVRYTVKDGKREEFYRHIVEQGIDTASGKKPETASMTTTIRQIPNRICACWSCGTAAKHRKFTAQRHIIRSSLR